MGIVKSHEQFIINLSKRSNIGQKIEFITHYNGSKTAIHCRCKREGCKREWFALPTNLYHGHGCPSCGIEQRANKRKLTHKEFLDKLKQKNKNSNLFEICSEYQGLYQELKCKCLNETCNHIWYAKPANLYKSSGCPVCPRPLTAEVKARKQENFIKKANEVHGYKYDYSLVDYVDCYTEVIIICPKENHGEFTRKTSVHLSPRKGCPLCNMEAKKKAWRTSCGLPNSHQELVVILEKKHPLIQVLGKYSKKEDEILFYCNKCGTAFDYLPDKLVKAEECPSCKKNAFTHPKKINHEEFMKRFKTKYPDFNGIKVLGTFVKSSLGIRCKCQKPDCSYEWDITPNNLLRGKKCPRCFGRYKTHEEFLEELRYKNPKAKNYIILSKYEKALKHIRCLCKLCDFTWDITPDNLLRGKGCPECQKKAGGFHKYEDLTFEQRQENSGNYVMIFQNMQEFFIKVGYSKEPKIRRNTLEKVSGYDVQILSYIARRRGRAVLREERLHKILKRQNYNPAEEFAGSDECFEVTSSVIKKLLKHKEISAEEAYELESAADFWISNRFSELIKG